MVDERCFGRKEELDAMFVVRRRREVDINIDINWFAVRIGVKEGLGLVNVINWVDKHVRQH